ncbi:MAG: IS3 family transposase [Thiotrichaceae bacterium]|nr:IS3 family transposase [Thiotrichaceae bacterium]
MDEKSLARNHFFRRLKTENMPKKGCENEIIAVDAIRDYIYKYYNSIRPHHHNLGLSPNEKEAYYWATFNSMARKG